MEYIQLRNGVKIPQIGLGVFQIPDGQTTADAVKWALQAGYRHIDAAAIYGNEKGVGDGIKASGVAREEIFLTTKLWNDDIMNGTVREAFQKSLDALQTDYVDLYLIHWPTPGTEKAWEVMEELYESGKCKAIGVSNFNIRHIEQLAKSARIQPMADQVESQPYFDNKELIDYCHANGIAVEAWSPLGGTGGTLLEDETLHKLAEKYGKTPAQIVLRWDIQRNIAAIPKSIHKERIESNLDVFDFELSETDMAAMAGLNKNLRMGPDPSDLNF